jgi:hypothetical protein
MQYASISGIPDPYMTVSAVAQRNSRDWGAESAS